MLRLLKQKINGLFIFLYKSYCRSKNKDYIIAVIDKKIRKILKKKKVIKILKLKKVI